MPEALIEVKNLKVHFFTNEGVVKAVDGVDFNIYRGKTLCVVGESGCGKSVTTRAIMQILHKAGRIVEARNRTIELLNHVGIPKPDRLVDEYPFRLSGGMRQRAMIAMALSCNPNLLIADEPTTALDVTTQAQILDLMLQLQEEHNMAILFITHDLGVVAEIADEVAVMYLGSIVEWSDADTIFNNPKHPYTQALLRSIPKIGPARTKLDAIGGMVPSPFRRPKGCVFHTRCTQVIEKKCPAEAPPTISLTDGHTARCWLYEER
jgi:peptide/nickel transport system ATP-binding protein